MKFLYSLDASLCFYVKLEIATKYYDPVRKRKDGKNKSISIRPAGSLPGGHPFILSGEEDFEVTGETTGNEEAFTLIEANPPQHRHFEHP